MKREGSSRFVAYVCGVIVGGCVGFALFARPRYEAGYEDAYHWCEQKVQQLALDDSPPAEPPGRWDFESSEWMRRYDPPGPVCGTRSLWAVDPNGTMRDLWDERSVRR